MLWEKDLLCCTNGWGENMSDTSHWNTSAPVGKKWTGDRPSRWLLFCTIGIAWWNNRCILESRLHLDLAGLSSPSQKSAVQLHRCISDRSAIISTQTESSPWQLFQYKHMTYQHSWRMSSGLIGSFTNEIQLKLEPRVVWVRNYCGR